MVEAPAVFDDGGLQWVRTEICKGGDLVDGTAWIGKFQERMTELQALSAGGSGPARGSGARMLRQTLSDGDDPQFYSGAKDPPIALRNMVLKEMADNMRQPGRDPSRGCGKKVKLINGKDVIFWFNVGPPGHPRDRVYVTDAYCPHQQVCLNEGELKDIEDISGQKKCMVRCHRHNKVFDLQTGLSPGNQERLQTYPRRFEHNHWYVAVGPSPAPHLMTPSPMQAQYESAVLMDPAGRSQQPEVSIQESEDQPMDVDPAPKRQRLEEPPTPCRSLGPHLTIA